MPSRTALLSDASLASDPSVAVGFKSLADAMPYDSAGWDDVFSVQQKIWDSIVLDGKDVTARSTRALPARRTCTAEGRDQVADATARRQGKRDAAHDGGMGLRSVAPVTASSFCRLAA